MKKFIIFILLFIVTFSTNVYAYSNGFLYMVKAMNIELTNVNGLALNEEIYQKYKLIVYGNPNQIKDSKQRWKSTENGNWSKDSGAWSGVGERGEYWILGQDFSGKSVHNEIFPDDYNSGTSPLNWKYRVISDAEESWIDASKYMYAEQRDYMFTQNLSRFGTVYDLTVLDIGLDKARLENYATWGSAGSVYTEKPGQGNVYWVATFSVPPMAGDAKLNSILELPNGTEYIISKDQEEIEIPFVFGSYIDGLSQYAKENHIKRIESELKINGVTNSIISNTETLKISKNGTLIVNKNDYAGMDKTTFIFDCSSFACTYFPSDPIMYSNSNMMITVHFENESKNYVSSINDKEAPIIYDISIKRLTTDSYEKIIEQNLYINKKTKIPFICAGQVIKIRVETSIDAQGVTFDFTGFNSIRTLDDLTKRFLWDEPKARKENKIYSRFISLENAYDLPRRLSLEYESENKKIFSGIYVIPYKTTQTLHSWDSLREEKKDAFNINESKLFTRQENPYTLVVKASSYDGMRSKKYKFDVAERWDELYNHDISKYISNY